MPAMASHSVAADHSFDCRHLPCCDAESLASVVRVDGRSMPTCKRALNWQWVGIPAVFAEKQRLLPGFASA